MYNTAFCCPPYLLVWVDAPAHITRCTDKMPGDKMLQTKTTQDKMPLARALHFCKLVLRAACLSSTTELCNHETDTP